LPLYSSHRFIVGGGGGGTGGSIPYDKMTMAQKLEYDKAMRGI